MSQMRLTKQASRGGSRQSQRWWGRKGWVEVRAEAERFRVIARRRRVVVSLSSVGFALVNGQMRMNGQC